MSVSLDIENQIAFAVDQAETTELKSAAFTVVCNHLQMNDDKIRDTLYKKYILQPDMDALKMKKAYFK